MKLVVKEMHPKYQIIKNILHIVVINYWKYMIFQRKMWLEKYNWIMKFMSFNLHLILPNYMWDVMVDGFMGLMYWMISNRHLS